MGYTDFSTPNADYTLHHALHVRKILPTGFRGLDCTILETPSDKGPDKADFTKTILDNRRGIGKQYSDILNWHMKTRRPAFFTDSPAKDGVLGFTSGVLGDYLTTILLPVTFSLILNSSGHPLAASVSRYIALYNTAACWLSGFAFLPNSDFSDSRVKKALSYTTELSQFYTHLALRDALTARKAEEIVAPEMEKRLGRKPRIGIVFGAGHYGMRVSIQHKRIRDAIIKAHSLVGYSCLDVDLNAVHEFEFPKLGKPVLRRLETDLFG
ncbi:MAG: hypothetical protein HYS53_00820 [Candidatus Aenigmarchaeota archaeon]|nr:hypothetical protein [Candidatus Aenigmarchaeota archaeon]